MFRRAAPQPYRELSWPRHNHGRHRAVLRLGEVRPLLPLIAALSLGDLSTPLPPIRRDPQVTYLDRSGAVIGVRGGRYGPPVDIAKLPPYRSGGLHRHRGSAVLFPRRLRPDGHGAGHGQRPRQRPRRRRAARRSPSSSRATSTCRASARWSARARSWSMLHSLSRPIRRSRSLASICRGSISARGPMASRRRRSGISTRARRG